MTTHLHHTKFKTRLFSPHVLPLIALFALVLAIFFPFGVANKPLIEEWGFISAFTHGQGFFYVAPYDSLRPLLASWTYLGYIIDPKSLNGFTIILFSLIYLKAITVYALVFALRRSQIALSLLTAVIFTIFPADTGVFNFRALAIHAASWLYFVALLAFIKLALKKKFDWRLMLIMIVTLIWGLLTYNAGYPLALLTPAIVLWLPPLPRMHIQRITRWWYIGLLFAIVLTFIPAASSFGKNSYEGSIFAMPTIPDAIVAIVYMLARQFALGWVEAVRALSINGLWLFAAVFISVVPLLWLYRAIQPLPIAKSGRLFLLGVSVMLLGYAAYLPTISRLADWRVAYYSSLGGALATTALLSFIRPRWVFAVFSGVIVILGIVHAYAQYNTFVQVSNDLEQLLRDTVAQVPVLDNSTSFVYLGSPDPIICHEWMVYHHGYLVDALRYIYKSDQVVDATVIDGNSRLIVQAGSQVKLLTYQPGKGYSLTVSNAAEQMPVLTYLPVAATPSSNSYPC